MMEITDYYSLIGIILRWVFLIWELIFFIYCRLFVLILVVFVLCLVKKKQHKNYQDEDKKSAIKKKNSQIKKPHLKMIPIKDNYKFGTGPTIEDRIRRTNNWIYKTKKIQPWSPFA